MGGPPTIPRLPHCPLSVAGLTMLLGYVRTLFLCMFSGAGQEELCKRIEASVASSPGSALASVWLRGAQQPGEVAVLHARDTL